jgi:SOS response regulatory protein OraA/RecX
MNREEIIRMAREAGFKVDWQHADVAEIKAKRYEYFAELVAAAEREKVAAWMMARGYATGHGNTIEELLQELDWQVREQEREACIDIVAMHGGSVEIEAAIRARGNGETHR